MRIRNLDKIPLRTRDFVTPHDGIRTPLQRTRTVMCGDQLVSVVGAANADITGPPMIPLPLPENHDRATARTPPELKLRRTVSPRIGRHPY